MAFTGPMEDRLLIRDLIGAYSDASMRCDVDAWLACFTEDAVRAHGGSKVQGKAALRAQWDGLWALIEKMGFFAEPGAIEVEGDRATARVWCRELVFLKAGGVRKVVGLYEDDLVRRDGRWLFARRSYRLHADEGTAPAA